MDKSISISTGGYKKLSGLEAIKYLKKIIFFASSYLVANIQKIK